MQQPYGCLGRVSLGSIDHDRSVTHAHLPISSGGSGTAGPMPCYEAIEEQELLESLYTFQRRRQKEKEREESMKVRGRAGRVLWTGRHSIF